MVTKKKKSPSVRTLKTVLDFIETLINDVESAELDQAEGTSDEPVVRAGIATKRAKLQRLRKTLGVLATITVLIALVGCQGRTTQLEATPRQRCEDAQLAACTACVQQCSYGKMQPCLAAMREAFPCDDVVGIESVEQADACTDAALRGGVDGCQGGLPSACDAAFERAEP